jgi:hypothetical protein
MSKIHCISKVLTIDIWENIQSSSLATFESLAIRVLASLQVIDLWVFLAMLIIINFISDILSFVRIFFKFLAYNTIASIRHLISPHTVKITSS